MSQNNSISAGGRIASIFKKNVMLVVLLLVYCIFLVWSHGKIFEPMQDSNDIIKMRERYPDRIWIGGADWGTLRPKHYPEYDEEEVRQSIRNILDKYAPGGSYAFYAWPISYAGDPVIGEVNRIIRDEAHWYGRKIYGYTED